MINLYFGSDTVATRLAAMEYVAARVDAGARIERIEPSDWSESLLSEMLGAVSLFGEVTVYVVDTPSEDEVFFEALTASAKELVAGSNTVVVIEKTFTAPQKKKWTTAGAELFEYTAAAAGDTFDVFKMAEAVLNRDKKSLWVLYATAKERGLSAEELIGTLWWQMKTLRLAATTSSAVEAGMKDYPYNKAKRALRNFKPGEIEKLSHDLLAVYHDGHGGVRDIDLALEEWVLRV